MTRPRAADDFPTIRARMEELRIARSRAADDFPAIRSRMEELRRERTRAPAEHELRRADGPRPYAVGSRPAAAGKSPGASSTNKELLSVSRATPTLSSDDSSSSPASRVR